MKKLPRGWGISTGKLHNSARWYASVVAKDGDAIVNAFGRTEAEARRKLAKLCERIGSVAGVVKGSKV